MNIKAIIASLVLGSSSVALAAPDVTFTASAQGAYSTTVVRDHRFESPPIMRPAAPPVAVIESPPIMRPAAPPVAVIESPPIMRPIGWRLPPVYPSVTLARGLTFASDGRKFITVGAQAGRFETLKIDAAGGHTFIKQVYVQFDNGQEQVVRNLDRTLMGSDCLTLDLDGNRRAIRRIVVYGTSLDNGNRRSPGAFTVTAS